MGESVVAKFQDYNLYSNFEDVYHQLKVHRGGDMGLGSIRSE